MTDKKPLKIQSEFNLKQILLILHQNKIEENIQFLDNMY